MARILIIASLVQALSGEYQEMKLISQLSNFFKFDHHIYLLHASADDERFINRNESTPRSLLTFKSVDDVGSKVQTEMLSKNTFFIIAPGDTEFVRNSTLLHRIKKIQRLQTSMKIGIFFSTVASSEDLRKLFEWCKEQLIVNVFAATYIDRSLNVFSFHPFGTFEVINVSGCWNDSIYPSLNSNFQQHVLKLCEFRFLNDALFWRTIFIVMNASHQEIGCDVHEVDEKMFENEINILPELFSQDTADRLNVQTLKVLLFTILVPRALPYPSFAGYLIAMSSNEVLVYCFLILAGVTVLLIVVRYFNRKKFLFLESVLDVLNLLMNDNGSIKYRQLFRGEVFLIVPLTFVGLVIVNGILSNLQSYVTRPRNQPEIDTANELFRSELPILVWNDNWKVELNAQLTYRTNSDGWNDRFVIFEFNNYVKHILTTNRSYSFISDMDVISIQKHLEINSYHRTKIEISIRPVSYPVNKRFLFFERLNELIHLTHSSGLFEHWYRQFLTTKENEIKRLLLPSVIVEEPHDSSLADFPFFIVYGWLTGVVVLLVEIIWKKAEFWEKQQKACVRKVRKILQNIRSGWNRFKRIRNGLKICVTRVGHKMGF